MQRRRLQSTATVVNNGYDDDLGLNTFTITFRILNRTLSSGDSIQHRWEDTDVNGTNYTVYAWTDANDTDAITAVDSTPPSEAAAS